jgi:hypothetical protein
VLPLWCDELSVVLAPEQVVLVRFGWTLSRRGRVRRIEAKSVVKCTPAADDNLPWIAAIKAVEEALPQMLVGKTVAKITLSNHFVRYTLVPWSETLNSAAEEEAYAGHCFKQLYGADSDQWELRLSPNQIEQPQLASAVDRRLLDGLREMFGRNGVSVKSIKPGLMTAYNNSRAELKDANTWFVLHEPGCLCLALLQHGNWSSVRTIRIGDDWRDTLSQVLEREAYLTEPNVETNTVFLWAPELAAATLPISERWQIYNLNPVVHPAFVQEYEGRFAMAMSG